MPPCPSSTLSLADTYMYEAAFEHKNTTKAATSSDVLEISSSELNEYRN